VCRLDLGTAMTLADLRVGGLYQEYHCEKKEQEFDLIVFLGRNPDPSDPCLFFYSFMDSEQIHYGRHIVEMLNALTE
jgi:hypothetical protein